MREYPELEAEDFRRALDFAASNLDDRILPRRIEGAGVRWVAQNDPAIAWLQKVISGCGRTPNTSSAGPFTPSSSFSWARAREPQPGSQRRTILPGGPRPLTR